MHRDVQYHCETPERITVCVQALDDYQKKQPQQIQLFDVAPNEHYTESSSSATIAKTHQPFTYAELQHARDVLLQTHRPDLVTQLEERCRQSQRQRLREGKQSALGFVGRIDADTFVTTETFDVCLRAAAAWIRAVDHVLLQGVVQETDGGEENNQQQQQQQRRATSAAAMALTRPPGHHATYAQQNGFCLYNFAAAAALHAVTARGCRRVAILDWDVHFGQGCADIVRRFQRQKLKQSQQSTTEQQTHQTESGGSIRYVSIHQTPAFPYEGERAEVIDNVVMTLPMPPDTTWTCGYRDLFEKALDFCCGNDDDDSGDDWHPDLVIVCAGYDALANDELASCSLTAADFGRMTRRLRERAVGPTKTAGIVLGLEGGYCVTDAGQSGNLADAVLETVRALVEEGEEQQQRQ